MSIIETITDVPAQHEKNVFGQFDEHIKKIEKTLNVTLIVRDGALKIIGSEAAANKAKSVFMQLVELSKRGNIINQQNVDYALSLSFEDKESAIVEIDKECICHTISGKPIKPKTLGQKQYADAMKKKMIVFVIFSSCK